MEPNMSSEALTSPVMPCRIQNELSTADLARSRTKAADVTAHGSTVGCDIYAEELAHPIAAPRKLAHNQKEWLAAKYDSQYVGVDVWSKQPKDRLADEDSTQVKSQLRTADSLERCLRMAMIESARKEAMERLFIPADEIDRIVNFESVLRELQRHSLGKDWDENDIAHQICCIHEGKSPHNGNEIHTSRRRIFATLVLVGQTVAIEEILREGLYDWDLPLALDPPGPRDGSLARRNADGSLRLVFFSKEWTTYENDAFFRCQWQLSSPCFEMRMDEGVRIKHYYLHDASILPITQTGEEKRPKGGILPVLKVKVHPAHWNSTSRNGDSNSWLALKRLRFRTEEAFKTEIEPLKRLVNCENAHIIRLLTTFEYRGEYNLMFEWADGGNLLDFWQSFPQPHSPPRNYELGKWLATQLTGLASALSLIHGLDIDLKAAGFSGFDSEDGRKKHGVHGNLKPQNILWFRAASIDEKSCNLDSFKLSDFASMTFRNPEKRKRIHPVTHRAPEYHFNRHISQKYDMWSLGCVLLEHLTWYLFGSDGVDSFGQKRFQESKSTFKEDNFFDMTLDVNPTHGGRATMKKCVQEHFDLLRNLPNCSDFVLDILDFVQDKLLRMCPDHRCDVSEFLSFTQEVGQKCMEDEIYCVQRLRPMLRRTWTNLSSIQERFSLGERNESSPVKLNQANDSRPDEILYSAGGAKPVVVRESTEVCEPARESEPTESQLGRMDTEHGRVPERPGTSGVTTRESEQLGVAESTELPESTEILESTRSPESTRPTELLENDVFQEAPNLHDAPTEYSASNRTNLPPIQESYISEFAHNIFQRLQADGLSLNDLEHISAILADSLKGFSTRLGLGAQSQIQLDIVYFAHKRRTNIQAAFERILHGERRKDALAPWRKRVEDGFESNGLIPAENEPLDNATRRKRVQDWVESDGLMSADNEPLDNALDFEVPDTPISSATIDEDSISEDGIPELEENVQAYQQYRDTIQNSPAYLWLLDTLRRGAILQTTGQDEMEEIRTNILRSFTGTQRISRSVSPKAHKATFILRWDPWEFVKERDSHELPEKALLGAITLTGSPGNAQAMMCSEYLTQTWPSTGKDVVLLLASIMRSVPDTQSCGTLADGTALTAIFDGQKTIFTAIGVAYSIAEIGQQLAWVGAALRFAPSNVATGLYTCSSNISSTAWKPGEHGNELIIHMDFAMEKSPSHTNTSGNCWHSMFKNPVLVTGFPILAKSIQESGIEMPLDIMACLTGSHRVIEFDEKLILKGFSTMLTAVKQTEGFFIWHYTFHADMSRMPFFEAAPLEDDNIQPGLLESSRHIIGWCSSARYHTGGPEANYDVKGSGLQPPSNGCILDKVSLSAGKPISFNANISFPVTNLPPHLTLDGYAHRLLYLEKQFVVMWDVGEKRGWLVNGTSALLHLVRAHFENIRSGNFSSLFDFDLCKITEAANKYHPTMSVAEVLRHTANRELVVGQGRTERYTEQKTTGEKQESTETLKKGDMVFEAFVEHFMSYLEQIMDHQLQLAGLGGVKLKGHVRRHLEGWDFRKILTSNRPTPSFTELHSLGWGWVDFVRSINAVTLFGRGFGDLIAPTEPQLMCPGWKILPKNRYYLAASAVDLMEAMEMHGSSYSSPPELVHGLTWHSPSSCLCAGATTGSGKKHCDPVQVLLPTASKHLLSMKGPTKFDRQSTAAFVFGHNFSRPLRWFDGSDIPEVLQESENSSLRIPSFTSQNPSETATRHIAEHMEYSEATASSSFTNHEIGSSSAHPEMTPASTEVSNNSERTSTRTTAGHLPVENTRSQRTNARDSQLVIGNPQQTVEQAPTLSFLRGRRRRLMAFISRRGVNRRSTESVTGELRSV